MPGRYIKLTMPIVFITALSAWALLLWSWATILKAWPKDFIRKFPEIGLHVRNPTKLISFFSRSFNDSERAFSARSSSNMNNISRRSRSDTDGPSSLQNSLLNRVCSLMTLCTVRSATSNVSFEWMICLARSWNWGKSKTSSAFRDYKSGFNIRAVFHSSRSATQND